MTARLVIILFASFLAADVTAQNSLPVKTWIGHSDSCILFISGDGGLNSFSNSLCERINGAGYTLWAIDARSYFWEKKTPQETAADILLFLREHLARKNNFSLSLIGYSFGADVLPFIVNRFPDSMKQKITSAILLSPSRTTDFEIHWSDILGGSIKRNMDVLTELNKMTSVKKVAVLFGNEEVSLPVNAIHLTNCTVEKLPGGHHFDRNTVALAEMLIKHLK